MEKSPGCQLFLGVIWPKKLKSKGAIDGWNGAVWKLSALDRCIIIIMLRFQNFITQELANGFS